LAELLPVLAHMVRDKTHLHPHLLQHRLRALRDGIHHFIDSDALIAIMRSWRKRHLQIARSLPRCLHAQFMCDELKVLRSAQNRGESAIESQKMGKIPIAIHGSYTFFIGTPQVNTVALCQEQ